MSQAGEHHEVPLRQQSLNWLVAAASLFLLSVAALVIAAWWGSNIVFHPPRMLKLEIFPDRYNLTYEPVEFRTSDGFTLKGWLIPAAATTDRTIVLFHGWGDNKGDLLQHTWFLSEKFNLFYFDSRHHGDSEGPLSTLGGLEARDTDAAFEFLLRHRPAWTAKLGVFGLSMGASLAVWAASHHAEVRSAVLEAPFPSFNGVITQFTCNEYNLPYFPFAWIALAVIRFRLGQDHEPFSPLYHIASVAPRPVFFIAGEEDALMPLPAVRRLHEAAGQPKELWVVAGARHGKCEETAGAEYHRRLLAFFDKTL